MIGDTIAMGRYISLPMSNIGVKTRETVFPWRHWHCPCQWGIAHLRLRASSLMALACDYERQPGERTAVSVQVALSFSSNLTQEKQSDRGT